jgi:hypothetical protein
MNEKNQLTSDISHYSSSPIHEPLFRPRHVPSVTITRNLNPPQSADPLKLIFVDQDTQYPGPAGPVGDPGLFLSDT